MEAERLEALRNATTPPWDCALVREPRDRRRPAVLESGRLSHRPRFPLPLRRDRGGRAQPQGAPAATQETGAGRKDP